MKKLIPLTFIIMVVLNLNGCASLKEKLAGERSRKLFNKGQAFVNNKEYEKAIESYKKSIEIWSDVAISHYALGNAYFLLNKYDNALPEFKKAIEYRPKDPVYYAKAADIYAIQNKPDQAIKMLTKALPLVNPMNKDIIADINISIGDLFYSQKEFKNALTHYKLSSSLKTFNIAYYMKQASAYKALKNDTMAYELLNKAASYIYTVAVMEQRKLPYFADLYNFLGKEEENRTFHNKALTYYIKTLSLFPKDETALKSVDRVRKRKEETMKKIKEAYKIENSQKKLTILVNILKQHQDSVRATTALANAYLENGQTKKAINNFELSLKYNKEYKTFKDSNKLSKIYIGLAESYNKTNKPIKAVEFYIKGFDLATETDEEKNKILDRIRDTYLKIWE